MCIDDDRNTESDDSHFQNQRGFHLRGLPILLLSTSIIAAPMCENHSTPSELADIALSEEQIRADLEEIASTPHPFGSGRQRQVATFLESRIKDIGRQPFSQQFEAEVPIPNASGPRILTRSVAGANIYAFPTERRDCFVLVGSHYDTKDIPGIAYRGANDSGSSTAGLLSLLGLVDAYSKAHPDKAGLCMIVGVFFDGEESVLPGWYDGERSHPAKIQDNTYGSRFAASQLVACENEGKCLPESMGGSRLKAMILMDMIGSPGARLTRDSNSDPRLWQELTRIAASMGHLGRLGERPMPIDDDHIPFRELGIPVINLIDFQHIDYWHKAGDDPSRVATRDLIVIVRLAAALSLHEVGVLP